MRYQFGDPWAWQFTGKEKVLVNLMHTDTTYFIPDKDYFVRVMEATFVRL